MSNRGRFFNKRRGAPNQAIEGNNFSSAPGKFRGSWSNRGSSQNFRGGRPNFHQGNRINRGANRKPFGNHERDETPGKRLSEDEIGITEYVSNLKGFSGIIKSRYSDFQVSEINLNGDIAKLTDLSLPKLPSSNTTGSAANIEDQDEELTFINKYNVEVLPLETWDKINALAITKEKTTETIEMDVTSLSKEKRTMVHDAVKNAFGRLIISSTVTKEEKKFILFSKYFKGVHVDSREKWMWGKDYVHFIVHKENCDTMEAASSIAESLRMHHIKPAFFGYAGTKDRRAKTSQWFSIKRVNPSRIVNGCKHLRNITVGNFTFNDYHLKLGCLKGNRFMIALRNVLASDEIINEGMQSIKDNGFINYYGLQRFGSRADIPTYKIGKCLLQGNYQEAIDLILEPRGPFARQLRKYRETRDISKSLFGIPRTIRSIEIKLLQGLSLCAKNDLVSALERIPRNTRLLYIHSYQSWVWNRCVSERIKRFGFICQAGDLVLLNPTDLQEDMDATTEAFVEWDDNDETSSDVNTSENKPTSETADGLENKTVSDIENDANLDGDTLMKDKRRTLRYLEDKPKLSVKVLTDEDIDAKTYTIFDVVLPLPGYSIEYPSNMKDFYEKLLKEDNLDLELKQRVKSYSLSGTYRHILTKPKDISWKTVRYSDPYSDLIASDLDELRKNKVIEDIPDGKYKALLLQITLSPSTYATMALREILKMDTSSESQAQNNNYHKEPEDQEMKESTSNTTDNPPQSEENLADMENQTDGDNIGHGEKRKIEESEDTPSVKKAKPNDD